MKGLWLALLFLAAGAASAAEVPPELRGRLAVEVTSCEPFAGGAGTRVVLVRVRALASGVRQPDIRCGAFVPNSEHALGWARVSGLEQLAAGAAREVMVLVPGDATHDECRCVVGDNDPGDVCEPWQSLEAGRCVEPDEVASAPPGRRSDEPADALSDALRVSRALAPLHPLLDTGRGPQAESDALCSAVVPTELTPLVFALVPEDGTVYVRALWRGLDAADQAAFALYVNACFGVARIVDAHYGVEIGRAPLAQP